MREFDSLPAILNLREVMAVLRISRSAAYKFFFKVGAWQDEDDGIVILKSDLVSWIVKNSSTIY